MALLQNFMGNEVCMHVGQLLFGMPAGASTFVPHGRRCSLRTGLGRLLAQFGRRFCLLLFCLMGT